MTTSLIELGPPKGAAAGKSPPLPTDPSAEGKGEAKGSGTRSD